MPRPLHLSNNEKDFFEKIISPDSVIDFTVEERPDFTEINAKGIVLAEINKNYELGQSCLMFIKTTQFLMTPFTPEINTKIAEFQIQRQTKFIKLIYESYYKENISSEYLSYLTDFFFESIWLYYNPEKVKEFFVEYYLLGSYVSGKNSLEYALNENASKTIALLSNSSFLSQAEIEKGIKAVLEFNLNILKKFEKNTVSYLPGKFYLAAGAISLAMGSLAESIFSLPILSTSIGLFFAGTSWLGFSSKMSEHTVSSELEERYIERAASCAKNLGVYSQYRELIMNPNISKNAKIRNAIRLNLMDLTREKLTLLKHKLKTKKTNTIPDESTKEIFHVYSSFESENKTDYSLENLKKYYASKKRTEKPQEKKSTLEQPTRSSTYNKISFSLSPELQQKGCLVKKDDSLSYFNFSKFIGDIPADIQQKISSNQYSFGGKKGEFEIFKELSNRDYELKLTDGWRIFFKKEGTVQVSASNSTHKEVPQYVAYNMGKK